MFINELLVWFGGVLTLAFTLFVVVFPNGKTT